MEEAAAAAADFDGGFGGAGEDNLSMPLGDFMAFLDNEDWKEQQHEVRYYSPPCPNSIYARVFFFFLLCASDPIRCAGLLGGWACVCSRVFDCIGAGCVDFSRSFCLQLSDLGCLEARHCVFPHECCVLFRRE